jgi:hypothetical protein
MGVNGADEPAAIVANEEETSLFRDRDSSQCSVIRPHLKNNERGQDPRSFANCTDAGWRSTR